MTPVMADDDTTILLKHWKALIISIAIIYYFRLPSPPPSTSPSLSPPSSPPTLSTYSISAWGKDRKTFEALVNTHLQVEGIGFSFDGLISTVLDNFYKATTVPGMPHYLTPSLSFSYLFKFILIKIAFCTPPPPSLIFNKISCYFYLISLFAPGPPCPLDLFSSINFNFFVSYFAVGIAPTRSLKENIFCISMCVGIP